MLNKTDKSMTDGISDHLGKLVEAGQDKVSALKDRASSTLDNLAKAIRARPWISVGLAFGIGYSATRLFRR